MPQAIFPERARERLRGQPPLSDAGQAYSDACLAGWAAAVDRTRARLDVPYGPRPEQVLDVFMPRHEGRTGRPAVVFLHGGAWTNGTKEWCAFMAPQVVALDAVLVSPSYRLLPAVDFPVPVEDCVAALRWTVETAVSLGVDPRRIVIGGHSAGGQIAALIAMRPTWCAALGLPTDALAGCCCVSATFNRRMVNPAVGAAFVPPGPEDAIQPDSPLALPDDGARLPFLLTWGGAEPPRLERTGRQMEALLRDRGCAVRCDVGPALDHFETHLEHGRPGSAVLDAFGEWLHAVTASVDRAGKP